MARTRKQKGGQNRKRKAEQPPEASTQPTAQERAAPSSTLPIVRGRRTRASAPATAPAAAPEASDDVYVGAPEEAPPAPATDDVYVGAPAAVLPADVVEPPTEEPVVPEASPQQRKEDLQYHLKADVAHDHGTQVFKSFEKVVELFPDARPMSLDEAFARDYFVKGGSRLKIEGRNIRYSSRVGFITAKKTDMFDEIVLANFKPFKDVENNEVGVLQDAGVQLYEFMKAQNIITYGSILDQASKPMKKNDALYFQPDQNVITINPADYGFSDKVKSVTISEFNGKTKKCKCDFTMVGSDGKIIPRGPVDVTLNKRSGDFMSNEDVKKILTSSTDEDAKFGAIIGKALGDTLLVASIEKERNPFYPVGKNLMKVGTGTDSPIKIKRIILNTGDQLNHTRAFIRGVHSMYSSHNAKSGMRTYEYLPGPPEDTTNYVKDQYNYTLEQFKKIITTMYTNYTGLLEHLQKFDYTYTVKDKDLYYVNYGHTNFDELKKYITEDLSKFIDILRTYVGFYYLVFYKYYESKNRDKLTQNDLDELNTSYNIIIKTLPFYAPQYPNTFVNNRIRNMLHFFRSNKEPILYSFYTIVMDGDDINPTQEVENAYVNRVEDIRGNRQIPYKKLHEKLRELTEVPDIQILKKNVVPTELFTGFKGNFSLELVTLYSTFARTNGVPKYFLYNIYYTEVEGTPAAAPATSGSSKSIITRNPSFIEKEDGSIEEVYVTGKPIEAIRDIVSESGITVQNPELEIQAVLKNPELVKSYDILSDYLGSHRNVAEALQELYTARAIFDKATEGENSYSSLCLDRGALDSLIEDVESILQEAAPEDTAVTGGAEDGDSGDSGDVSDADTVLAEPASATATIAPAALTPFQAVLRFNAFVLERTSTILKTSYDPKTDTISILCNETTNYLDMLAKYLRSLPSVASVPGPAPDDLSNAPGSPGDLFPKKPVPIQQTPTGSQTSVYTGTPPLTPRADGSESPLPAGTLSPAGTQLSLQASQSQSPSVVGGQRVSLAKFIIDFTKSFVR